MTVSLKQNIPLKLPLRITENSNCFIHQLICIGCIRWARNCIVLLDCVKTAFKIYSGSSMWPMIITISIYGLYSFMGFFVTKLHWTGFGNTDCMQETQIRSQIIWTQKGKTNEDAKWKPSSVWAGNSRTLVISHLLSLQPLGTLIIFSTIFGMEETFLTNELSSLRDMRHFSKPQLYR